MLRSRKPAFRFTPTFCRLEDRTTPAGGPNTPPTIADISNAVSHPFGPPGFTFYNYIGTVQYHVSDAETPQSLIVTASSSNPVFIPNTSDALRISASDGTLTLTPNKDALGTSVITLTVTDPDGATASTKFTVGVVPDGENTSPNIDGAHDFVTGALVDQTIAPGGSRSLVVGPYDGETPVNLIAVTLSSDNQAVVPASGLAVANNGGYRTLTITPAAGVTSGSTVVRVTSTDGGGLTSFKEFTVTVGTPPVSNPPTVSVIPNQTATAGTMSTTPQFSVHDPEDTSSSSDDSRLFATSSNPSLIPPASLGFFTDLSGHDSLYFTPVAGAGGKATLTVVAVGAKGAYTSRSFDVTVVVPPPITLALAGGSATEFRPVGTAAGTLSAAPADGHTYTYALVSGTGSTDNASFTISGNTLRAARPFDLAAKGSYSVRVRATDQTGASAEKAFAIAVADDPAVARSGRVLTVTGTSGADTFVFAAGAAQDAFALNGTTRAVQAADVDRVVFNGGVGVDAANLYGLGAGNAAGLTPTYGYLRGAGFEVDVNGTEAVTAHAGSAAGATAALAGSAGADAFAAYPGYAALTGAGFANYAVGFAGVTATLSAGGTDAAYLSDSPAVDTFTGSGRRAVLSGPGFYLQVDGAAGVTVFGTAGGRNRKFFPGSVAYFLDLRGSFE